MESLLMLTTASAATPASSLVKKKTKLRPV